MFQNVALPALQNVQKALAQAGHASDIKATIPCNADVLSSPPPYLPSQTTFRPDISSLMIQISQFLASTGAPFMVNFYPFLSLVLSTNFPLAFAFFNGSANSVIDGPHVYTNVFDASYDGLVTALTNSGFPTLPIIVGEIGWPTDGVPNANLQFAESFMSELVKHMLSLVHLRDTGVFSTMMDPSNTHLTLQVDLHKSFLLFAVGTRCNC
jgi:hypothetical protein